MPVIETPVFHMQIYLVVLEHSKKPGLWYFYICVGFWQYKVIDRRELLWIKIWMEVVK
jgi:hypothetical protein